MALYQPCFPLGNMGICQLFQWRMPMHSDFKKEWEWSPPCDADVTNKCNISECSKDTEEQCMVLDISMLMFVRN